MNDEGFVYQLKNKSLQSYFSMEIYFEWQPATGKVCLVTPKVGHAKIKNAFEVAIGIRTEGEAKLFVEAYSQGFKAGYLQHEAHELAKAETESVGRA